MALTLKITSNTSSEKFKDLLRNGLERATDGNSYLIEDEIRDFLNIFPKKINKYDIFNIIYTKEEGLTLYNNMTRLGAVKNLDFKKAFFKIWLGENPVNEELKESLLGSSQSNPVLGKWKTYDKKTGVALSVVELYMIKNSIFGAIERMLRQSERDAVCYECKGDDKNKNVEGLIILKRLRLDGAKYTNGKFTDIKTGQVSDCQIWIDKKDINILHVKYKGGGGVHDWKRIE